MHARGVGMRWRAGAQKNEKDGGQKRERFELKDTSMRHPGGDRYKLLLPDDDDHHAGPGPSSSRMRDRQGPSGARHTNGGEVPRDRKEGRDPSRGYDRDRRDPGRGRGDHSHRDPAADEHRRHQGRKRSRSRDREPSRGGRPGPPDHGRYQDYDRRDPDRRVLPAKHVPIWPCFVVCFNSVDAL